MMSSNMQVIIVFLISLLLSAHAFSGSNFDNGKTSAAKHQAVKFYSSEETLNQGFPFSDSVLVGNTLYLSGMIGTDLEGKLVTGGVEPETHAIFRQLKAHLAIENLTLKHVVKCLVMLDDISKWANFNKVYVNYFKPPYPARSALGADGLALGAALEMECIAAKP